MSADIPEKEKTCSITDPDRSSIQNPHRDGDSGEYEEIPAELVINDYCAERNGDEKKAEKKVQDVACDMEAVGHLLVGNAAYGIITAGGNSVNKCSHATVANDTDSREVQVYLQLLD